jgi:glyoxylase-like metal-dependent hydrolase (beta-lactamase superfamily II)
MWKILAAVWACCMLPISARLSAQEARLPVAAAKDITVHQIRRNVFLLSGDGANITVQIEPPAGEESFDSVYGGDRGILIVDTGTAAMSDALLAAIRQLSSGPIRYIVNTSADADHVGGNATLAKASGGAVRAVQGGAPAKEPLMILAHETVLERVSAPSGKQSPMPIEAWPTDVFASDKEAFINGGSVKIYHQPGAHSDGDAIVYLRKSDVIAAGEIFSTTNFPPFDIEKGGHIQGILDGLNRILEIAIPGEKEQGGTMIVPAHGRLCDEADVEFYREMVQIVRDRVQDGVRSGKTLEQVKASKPTLEYAPRYSQPNWTADMFVEAIYKDLSRSSAASKAGAKSAVPGKAADASREKGSGK